MRGSLQVGWRSPVVIALAGYLSLTGALDAQNAAAPEPAAPGGTSALDALIYVDIDVGAPEATESGGVRGVSQGLPEVFVLAPPKLARTLSAQPTLYWYVSGPSTAPLRLTLLDVAATTPEPLLETDLGAVPAAGVYGASLAAHDLRLQAGHSYEWSVALEVNPDAYSEEPVAKTVFTVGEADPALLATLADAPALARAKALAAAGYWYDALDLLAQKIADGDPSQPWRQLRAGLLDRVGLRQVATFDRAGRDGQ